MNKETSAGKENKKDRVFAFTVMGIYLLFLCWLILFKLANSVDEIPSMREINLIPFYYDQLSGSRVHLNEVLYNILVFVPAGFYFTAFGKRRFLSGIVSSALLSLCFEVLQWVFALGASDITDLITNTVGGILGSGMYFFLRKLCRGREVRIVSIAGAGLEAIFVCLMIVLLISNS